MTRTLFCAFLSVGAPVVSLGQPTEGKPAFEVASVKPAAPITGVGATMFRMRGGPGTDDTGQISYSNISMQQLLILAYGLHKQYRLAGPNWLENEKYDIVAKLPAGATKEQVNVMLQNLLVDRFGLATHHETRDLPGYEMVVARNGPKIKESPESPAVAAATPAAGGPPSMAISKDKDGLLEFPPGTTALAQLPAGVGITRYSARNQPLSAWTAFLENPLGRPVMDRTGLTGKYDFNLTYTGDQRTMANVITNGPPATPSAADAPNDAGPDLFTAMQEQLGLKLESKKIPIDVLVIDRLEKTATAN